MKGEDLRRSASMLRACLTCLTFRLYEQVFPAVTLCNMSPFKASLVALNEEISAILLDNKQARKRRKKRRVMTSLIADIVATSRTNEQRDVGRKRVPSADVDPMGEPRLAIDRRQLVTDKPTLTTDKPDKPMLTSDDPNLVIDEPTITHRPTGGLDSGLKLNGSDDIDNDLVQSFLAQQRKRMKRYISSKNISHLFTTKRFTFRVYMYIVSIHVHVDLPRAPAHV